MLVLASVDKYQGSIEDKKLSLSTKEKEERDNMDKAFADGATAFRRLNKEVSDAIKKFCPGSSILPDYSTKGIPTNNLQKNLQKLGAVLKKCFGWNKGLRSYQSTQDTPLSRELKCVAAPAKVKEAFEALKLFLKGYTIYQTVLVLKGAGKKLNKGQKDVDSFLDFLQYYRIISIHNKKMEDNVEGIVVTLSTTPSDCKIEDIYSPEESK